MFILRTKTKNGYTENSMLGESYVLVYKDTDPDLFYKIGGDDFDPPDSVFALLNTGAGTIFPLQKDMYYYVMTDSGKTFERIYRQDPYVERPELKEDSSFNGKVRETKCNVDHWNCHCPYKPCDTCNKAYKNKSDTAPNPLYNKSTGGAFIGTNTDNDCTATPTDR